MYYYFFNRAKFKFDHNDRIFISHIEKMVLVQNGDQIIKIHQNQWKGYDSLIFNGYKHLSVDHSKMFGKGDVYINGIEGFWSYAKENMAKHHGVSPEKFLLYIKEM